MLAVVKKHSPRIHPRRNQNSWSQRTYILYTAGVLSLTVQITCSTAAQEAPTEPTFLTGDSREPKGLATKFHTNPVLEQRHLAEVGDSTAAAGVEWGGL